MVPMRGCLPTEAGAGAVGAGGARGVRGAGGAGGARGVRGACGVSAGAPSPTSSVSDTLLQSDELAKGAA